MKSTVQRALWAFTLKATVLRHPLPPAPMAAPESEPERAPAHVRLPTPSSDWSNVRFIGMDGAGSDDMAATWTPGPRPGGYVNPEWFGQGGMHQGGWRIVGERTPELIVMCPRRAGKASQRRRAVQQPLLEREEFWRQVCAALFGVPVPMLGAPAETEGGSCD